MRFGIRQRFFWAILAATCAVVVGMLLFMRWSFDRGFLRYIASIEEVRMERLAEDLEAFYAEKGGWALLRKHPGEWVRLLEASLPEERRDPRRIERLERRLERERDERPNGRPPRVSRHFEWRVVLLDAEGRAIFGPEGLPPRLHYKPIRYRSEVVGRLALIPPPKELGDDLQLRFVRQQKKAFTLIALAMAGVAALIALPVAGLLVRRIRILASATHQLAAGNYDVRVPGATSDELGMLADDFNALAQTLERNEWARRQWVADISHELRTPLAVMRGEVEALQDGIRPAGPESLDSLHGEVDRLGRLVDDLYQLSLSDLGALSYRKESVDPFAILASAVEAHRPAFEKKGISLLLDSSATTFCLFADRQRLQQLFDNLLENSLRYTDPGGSLCVSMKGEKENLLIDLHDSAPGVSEAECRRLFDRLYRVEASRGRETGGAGLGLTISRNIVEAHQGTITAHPSPAGGLHLRLSFPLQRCDT